MGKIFSAINFYWSVSLHFYYLNSYHCATINVGPFDEAHGAEKWGKSFSKKLQNLLSEKDLGIEIKCEGMAVSYLKSWDIPAFTSSNNPELLAKVLLRFVLEVWRLDLPVSFDENS